MSQHLAEKSSLTESGRVNDTDADVNADAPENAGAVLTKQVSVFVGPIPPSHMLAEYKSVGPEVVESILRMAEKSQDFIQDQKRKEQEIRAAAHRRKDSTASRGQIFRFIISLVSLLLGAIFAYQGNNVWGSIFFFIGVGNLSFGGVVKLLRQRKDKLAAKQHNDDSQ